MGVAWAIARREMRGGLSGFRVFLACLALGVAAIAAIGTVRDAISEAIGREGAVLLGGDAEIELTYRRADAAELAWMQARAVAVSEIINFRSMAVVGSGQDATRALTSVKAIDGLYPLYGSVGLDPPVALDTALAGRDGMPGAVLDPLLANRLGLAVGDVFALGTKQFVLGATLQSEPDNGGGFNLAPRTILRTQDLDGSGLLMPGTLFEAAYRLRLPPDAKLDALKDGARSAIAEGAGRWRDRRNGAPGVNRFVERLADFLILVGLSGLIVGGVGVSAAVRAYLDEKVGVIATLKSVGAEARVIFAAYFIQIAALAALGIAIGLAIGAALPALLAPVISDFLPVTIHTGIRLLPLGQAAVYGLLTAAIFSIWPLARAENIRAAALFRNADLGVHGWPRMPFVIISAVLLAALIATAIGFSGELRLTLWVALGLAGAYVALVLAGLGLRVLARFAARQRALARLFLLRQALGAVGGPGSAAATVVVSLGLGLAVLSAIGQIDTNLRSAIAQDLPEVAPSFFFVDIQTDQLPGFLDRMNSDPGVSKVDAAPMLRGIITKINDRPAREVAGNHWVVSGDRGVTYAAAKPEREKLTAGAWWPENYDGPPHISFAATEAAEIGLSLGDTMTVNILGRDITATVTSFRNVDFSTAGMGFVIAMNPGAVAGAPHSHIATVYADQSAEAGILRDIGSAYPNITAIGVRDAIERVSGILRAIGGAITYAAAASLATGAIVLIGAAAAGQRSRLFEAAVLKTLGATRANVLANFALRSALLGLAAGAVAVICGAVGGWAVMTFVMEAPFRFAATSSLFVVGTGIALTVLAGLAFTMRALAVRPAQILRSKD